MFYAGTGKRRFRAEWLAAVCYWMPLRWTVHLESVHKVHDVP